MLYFTPPSGAARHAIAAGLLGQIATPEQGNRIVPGARWVLDNGCFSKRWDVGRWLATLERYQGVPGCLWAVVPDVVGDARGTNSLWCRWMHAVLDRGYRAAYVLQDGCRGIPLGASAVFVGGTDEFKLGPQARRLVEIAKTETGCWAHMGRVNSLKRLRYAQAIGCDSVDGTYAVFGMSKNLPKLLAWSKNVNAQTALLRHGHAHVS